MYYINYSIFVLKKNKWMVVRVVMILRKNNNNNNNTTTTTSTKITNNTGSMNDDAMMMTDVEHVRYVEAVGIFIDFLAYITNSLMTFIQFIFSSPYCL